MDFVDARRGAGRCAPFWPMTKCKTDERLNNAATLFSEVMGTPDRDHSARPAE